MSISPKRLSISMRPRRSDIYRRCSTLTLLILVLIIVVHFALKHSRPPPVDNHANGTIRMSRYWKANISSKIPPTDFSDSDGKTGSAFWNSPKINFECPGKLLDRSGKSSEEGGKWTCGLERLGWLTQKRNYKCKVYTFGISNETKFEEKILIRTGCTVYVHDTKTSEMMGPLQNNPRVTFRRVGIDGDDGISINGYVNWVAGAQLSTLRTIMDFNAHKWIDILKIDVQGEEFESLERILQDFAELPFGQLLVEMHVQWLNADWATLTSLFKRLEAKGMRLFHVEPSKYDINYVAEFSFINLHTLDLFIGETY